MTLREAEAILWELEQRFPYLGAGEILKRTVEEQEAVRVMELALTTAGRTARREARVRPDQPVIFFYRHQWPFSNGYNNRRAFRPTLNFWPRPHRFERDAISLAFFVG